MRRSSIKVWIASVLLSGAGCVSSVGAADFSVLGGAIPDNTVAGANFNFAVSGITEAVGQVSISLNLTHTYVGDLQATLTSPNGTAHLVLFSRLGTRKSGSSGQGANLSGTYTFDDLASTDVWVAANGLTTVELLPGGVYRTSTAGGTASNHGGCTTRLNLAFGGLSGAQVNGTWTLNVADLANGDTGSLNVALLSINPTAQLLSNGFEDGAPAPAASTLQGSCTRAFHDYSGRGLSSYALVRNTGGGANGAITWFIKENDGTTTGAVQSIVFGQASDTFVDGDYDGDGISDLAVYRASAGAFLVRRSSRPNDTILTIPLSGTSANPRNVGDFDGDNVTDATVYVPGAAAGLASQTRIRLSRTGTLRELTTGENGAFHSGGIDYSGDGLADIVMQSNAGGGLARIRLYNGVTGGIFDDFNFDTPVSVIVTGNFSGNALGDLTAVRSVSSQINWFTRETTTGLVLPSVIFGEPSSDFILAGDFDGDGVSDHAVWRPSATAGQSKFVIRRSSAPAGAALEVLHGANGDYPVGNSRTN